MKVSELSGGELDFWVAKADGKKPLLTKETCYYKHNGSQFLFRPSSTWYESGPIIERENISLEADNTGVSAYYRLPTENGLENFGFERGRTHLEAAMRCFVAKIYGQEVP